MKYPKFIAALILILLGNIGFAQTAAPMPTAAGAFIAWQSLPTVPTSMSVGTPYQLTYTVKNNSFAPSLPLTISVSHASGGSTPGIGDNTCQTALAIGQTCSFNVNITPTSSDIAAGVQDTVSVSYQGRGSPLTSSINATVNGVTASLTGPSSTQQTTQVSGVTQNLVYTLTNTSSSLPITSINVSGISAPETVINQCGGTLAPAASCLITVQLAAEASNIGTTIPAATLTVDYGGASNLTQNIAAISITAPMLAIATDNGRIYTLPSSSLGSGTWSQVSSLGTTDTLSFHSILGLATLNSDEQALNPTLLAAGNNTTTNAKPTVFSIDDGASWSATNNFPSTPSTLHIFSQAYDGSQHIMAAGCTSVNGVFCTAAPSFWYTTHGENQQGTWTLSFDAGTIMTPFAFAYGNGYFVSAMGVFSGGTFSNQKVVYGTSPSTSWTTEDLGIGTGYYPKGLVYANHTWVMVLSKVTPGNGLVYYATVSDNSPPTAASWHAATGTFVKNMVGVVYDAAISKFIAVGYDISNHAYVYTSSDGITWSSGTEIGSGALQGSFVVTGITYSQSTGVVVIAGYSSSSTEGAVVYNAGSDMSTGWQQMRNMTPAGSLPAAIASSTQT